MRVMYAIDFEHSQRISERTLFQPLLASIVRQGYDIEGNPFFL